jgi:LPXTG-site transpeptidase (sortase) family protein
VGAPQDQAGGWNLDWLAGQVGYLEGTAFPTHAGNSVLAGHAYLSNGLPGPFANISSLVWGDQVVVRAWGQKFIYEVRSVDTVSPADGSTLRHEDQPWITLVTCKNYDDRQKLYTERLVVRAALINVE